MQTSRYKPERWVALMEEKKEVYLDFSRSNFSDAGCHLLSSCIQRTSSAIGLTINRDRTGDSGWEDYGEALRVTRSIASLRVKYPNLLLGEDAVLSAMTENVSVKSLKLVGLRCFSLGAGQISALMAANTTIATLRIHGVEHDDEPREGPSAWQALGKGLSATAALRELRIERGGQDAIDEEGWLALGEGLADCLTIRFLYLEKHGLHATACRHLGEAIAVNRLERLIVARTGVDDDGCIALAHGLAESAFLTELDLGSNDIGDAGAEALAEALEENESLTTLDMFGNMLGLAGCVALLNAAAGTSPLCLLDLGCQIIY